MLIKGEFVRVAATNELAPGQVKPVRLDGRLITLANVNGEYSAVGANCCIRRTDDTLGAAGRPPDKGLI